MIKPYDGSLYRGLTQAPEARADEADSTYMQGHFAVFDTWTEIHSYYEGDFLERIAPGAFKRTIGNHRSSFVCQLDHGYDAHVGDMPLGPFDDIREDDEGLFCGVPLYDTDYNRGRVLPLLAGRTMGHGDYGSALGASFRFRVMHDEWVEEPKRSDANPDGLPERTIREVRLFEAGPVVFPAYPEANAGLRSVCLTDRFEPLAAATRSRVLRSTPPGPATGDEHPTGPAQIHPEEPQVKRSLDLATRQFALLAPRKVS